MKTTRVRRRLPWEWKCLEPDFVWHSSIDDVGWANSQAEAIEAADRHSRQWHDPENPIQICATELRPPRWDNHTNPWNCVRPAGHEGDHAYYGNFNDPGWNDADYPPYDERGILGVTFDLLGRILDEEEAA